MIYVYANTHSHAYGNLKYFIETAVREGDGVDYYFILQQIGNKTINENDFPVLPKVNAHYIQHEDKCFDFGTIGWFFDEHTVGNPWLNQTSLSKINRRRKLNLLRYKYFILMNSSIRGPFFPPYFLQLLLDPNIKSYWYSIFTKRITDKVKLVGCTISCETVPHVQTYFSVTDFVGLSILLKPGKWGATDEGIFACYPTKDHVSINSQLPSSNRILDSGFMIDSLLTKYQTINFSEPRNRACNSHNNPYKDKALDGTSMEPYEVVFVKFNDLEFLKESKDRAQLYQKWNEQTKTKNNTI